ncbi:MAG: hypothetical protein IM638_06160 [Bacteroidetes bacterium]|nr:hypothetical protein [Bacteroidota bacterium]
MGIKEAIAKRPAMFFGNGTEWFYNLLNFFFRNKTDLSININHHQNRLQLYCAQEFEFIRTGNFPYIKLNDDTGVNERDNEGMFLLLVSEQPVIHCVIEGQGKVSLEFDNDELVMNESEYEGFFIEFNFNEHILQFLKLTDSRLRNDLLHWLTFHSSLSVNYYSHETDKTELLYQPRGTDVLFEGLLKTVSLSKAPFRGEAVSGNVSVKLTVGFHDNQERLVKSYVNGMYQLYDEGIQIKVLQQALFKSFEKLRVILNGNYVATILIDLPESEIEWHSPIRNYRFANVTVFRLIDEIISENLSNYVVAGDKPFLHIKCGD